MAQVNKTIQMVNVFDEPVRIVIGGNPGDGVTEYVIKPGEAQAFHENLCKPVPGAGPAALPSILSRKSTRTWVDGVRRPCLIPADEAKKVKAEYLKQLENWRAAGSKQPKTEQPEPPAR